MRITIIAAVAKNGVIGRKNRIPWVLQADMIFFRTVTTPHAVIMGRKTFESLPCSLSNRKNIILTSMTDDEFMELPQFDTRDFIFKASSIDGALKACRDHEEVFIIGGSQVYEEFAHLANRFLITEVNAEVEGDSKFPIAECLMLNGRSKKLIQEQEANQRNQYAFKIYEYS